jgi:hypothetical protein
MKEGGRGKKRCLHGRGGGVLVLISQLQAGRRMTVMVRQVWTKIRRSAGSWRSSDLVCASPLRESAPTTMNVWL